MPRSTRAAPARSTPASSGRGPRASAPRRTTLLATIAGFVLVLALGAEDTMVLSSQQGSEAAGGGGDAVHASAIGIHELGPSARGGLEEVVAERVAEVPDALVERVAAEPAGQVQAAGAAQPAAGSGVFQQGTASWYGPGFVGNTTANGETYDPTRATAAHRALPFGTRVRVTNRNNGRSVVVRINDRGPYVDSRIIDLSEAAAAEIGVRGAGLAPVTLEIAG